MKKIGGNIYVHKSNIDELTEEQTDLVYNALMFLRGTEHPSHTYEIIKIDTKNIAVTFIESFNWDSAREPIVGNAYKVDCDGNVTMTKQKKNPQIYHHKWMFVADDYTGFDVDRSKDWSRKWQEAIPNDREIKSRIGYKDFWKKTLKEYGLK